MAEDRIFDELLYAIAECDAERAFRLIERSPRLATASAEGGATREFPAPHFLEAVHHYVYAGDTALHIAAAAHRPDIARRLIDLGADVRARNRRGAEPVHYASDGSPDSPSWNPGRQAATIAYLIKAGADPNAINQDGATPLHRAVRTRSAAAVRALLEGGGDPRRPNKSGSTPARLATITTGRSGSGSAEAKSQQAEIVSLLEPYGDVA